MATKTSIPVSMKLTYDAKTDSAISKNSLGFNPYSTGTNSTIPKKSICYLSTSFTLLPMPSLNTFTKIKTIFSECKGSNNINISKNFTVKIRKNTNLHQQKTHNSSKKQRILIMHNNIQFYLLSDHFHRAQIIRRYRNDQYTIVVFISSLYFRQILPYAVIFCHR